MGDRTGAVTSFDLDDSTAYPGTTRRFWVHVPPGTDPAAPSSLVVCCDGAGFLDPDDDLRAGQVIDELVVTGRIPATIGVFVDPGTVAGGRPDGRRQRNVEYDAFDAAFAGFVVDEVLPHVTSRWSVADDPARRAVVGFSSGGSCAFTAAWHRPDVFGSAVGFSASFAQLAGGNPYPDLLARTPRKPLRVYLQVGRRDLGFDEPEDNWLAENLRVAAALAEAGYDARLEVTDGGHDSHDAGVLLPEALCWALATPSATP